MLGVSGFDFEIWQNVEKQSFFSVNIPSKRQFIRLKLSKNHFFISYPTIQVRQKP